MSPNPMTAVVRGNLLLDYYERLPDAIASIADGVEPVTEPASFSPGFWLPELDDGVREFLAPAQAGWQELAEYAGHRLTLLDLTGNPDTNTTKTFASLLIVARAVAYIRRTGESVLIFSPTSANKGTALRDAVLRAIECGLVSPEQLRMVTLAPASCRQKLRASRLSTDDELRALNPLLLYTGEPAEHVKALGRDFVQQHAADIKSRLGVNVWFSLELRNYLIADTARAFFEHTVDPIDKADRPRLHAHAVSSAFGLLGYHEGRALLEAEGSASAASRPASLLVQHLGTPDMVLNLRTGSFDRAGLPDYVHDGGGYRQDADPHFPYHAEVLDEVLDPTFYTHQPATSPAMNAIIDEYGGDGIVVSRRECRDRYPYIRGLLSATSRPLPDDVDTLREWSVVMALTGVCNAIDRGLIPDDRDVVVHGSGWYSTDDFEPLPDSAISPVRSVDDIAAAVT